MAKFLDGAGRSWDVAISVGVIRRVRDRLGIDLSKLVENEFAVLQQVVTDPVVLCDVLYVMVEPQAAGAGVSAVEFGEALTGDAIEGAADALYEAFANFSPSRIRVPLLALAQKGREIQTAAATRAREAIEALPEAVAYWTTATGSPGSSESTPTH